MYLKYIYWAVVVGIFISIILLGFNALNTYEKYGWKHCMEIKSRISNNTEVLCFDSKKELNSYLESMFNNLTPNIGDNYINKYTNISFEFNVS